MYIFKDMAESFDLHIYSGGRKIACDFPSSFLAFGETESAKLALGLSGGTNASEPASAKPAFGLTEHEKQVSPQEEIKHPSSREMRGK